MATIAQTMFELLQALGSVGSMLGGVYAAKQLTLDQQNQAIKQIEEAENLGIIDDSLLKNIANRVKKSVKRLSDAYNNPSSSRQDIDREKEIARHEICLALQDIMEFNRGALPGDYLQGQWDSFNCSEAV